MKNKEYLIRPYIFVLPIKGGNIVASTVNLPVTRSNVFGQSVSCCRVGMWWLIQWKISLLKHLSFFFFPIFNHIYLFILVLKIPLQC